MKEKQKNEQKDSHMEELKRNIYNLSEAVGALGKEADDVLYEDLGVEKPEFKPVEHKATTNMLDRISTDVQEANMNIGGIRRTISRIHMILKNDAKTTP